MQWVPGLISWSGRLSREGNGYPLQYSFLENSMERGTWWATVHGICQARVLEWVATAFSVRYRLGMWYHRITNDCADNACYPLTEETSGQFSAQSCPTLCHPMNHSMPGLPVHHQLPESTQTHIHWVGDAIQPSHPLSSPSPPALNLSQHQGLFKWVSSLHQVTKVLSFSFKISPTNEYPGLISFRMEET